MHFPADFADAHIRHWQDAEFLFKAGRLANADQLYGYSAECGLKAVMVASGMDVDATTGTPTEPSHRKHIQALWDVFLSFVRTRPVVNLLRHLPRSNPFTAWSHHNRYAGSHHFDSQAVAPHRDGARQVRQFLLRLKVSGHV